MHMVLGQIMGEIKWYGNDSVYLWLVKTNVFPVPFGSYVFIQSFLPL